MTTPAVLLRVGEVVAQRRTIRIYVDDADPDTGTVWLRRIDPAPVKDIGTIRGLGTFGPKPELPSDWGRELVQEVTSAVIGAWERWQWPPRDPCTEEVEIDGRLLRAVTSPGAEAVGFWGADPAVQPDWVATVYMVGRIRIVNDIAHEVEPRTRPSWTHRDWLGEDDSDRVGRATRRTLVDVAKRTAERCNRLLGASGRQGGLLMPSASRLAALAGGVGVAVGIVYAANVARLTRVSLDPGAMLAYRADDADLDRYRPGLAVIRDDELWWHPSRIFPSPARVLHRYEVTLKEYRESPELGDSAGHEPAVFLHLWTTRGSIAFAAAPVPAKRLAAWAEEDSHVR